ncbi:unnamed protein product [Rhizophagus irregularis]|uniref:Uncharacterized protein n=1 Tax=Rhizophagus irregularis TaxID=588596 RepID=A0A2I1HD67_9GLOM|nr:hypothetical protein RhiirA4_537912 [Rhizophagus irregularis]PKY56824.1 hypothetical protein RhiirA4_448839 [Rhizophagus irregularis]CAB4425590.1 unnamed protein product [Rhizophagus irregularis]
MNSINVINVEEWKNSKYLDYNNTFNIIKDILNAFHDYEMNNVNILPIKFINDIKNQEFIFYQLIKEDIALESYRFSLYSDDVIIYIDMLMKESIELNDLLEVLKSLFEDTKIRLNFMEDLYNKYKNNDEMKKILNNIHEYGHHTLNDNFTSYNSNNSNNPFHFCLASLLSSSSQLSNFLSFIKPNNKSSLNQPLLNNENENQSNLEISFQELIFKHEKGLNIIYEIKQFWKNQFEIINKFIDIFEKGEKKDEILLSQEVGQDIRNNWEEEKKNSEIFYHKIRNLLK